MKQHLGFGGFVIGSTLVALTAQPVSAAATIVTDVRVNRTDEGIELILQTQAGDRPQIFTINRGNSLTADIINTQLQLPEGNSFQQSNPVPGISAIVVSPLDANSIRVTVQGTSAAPSGEVSQRGDNRLVFNFNPAGGTGTAAQPAAPTTTAQTPPPAAPQPSATPAPAPEAPAAAEPPATPGVLVPDPEITIDGVPIPSPQPQIVPPLLPRAVAPPVGDIAVATIDSSPSAIDLGTAERVPRLVLREAPAREVLALLARAAGLNLAFTAGEEGGTAGQPAAPGQPAAGSEGPRLSLDIEDEPVQDVFNYVLRITGLEANRVGRTIFVGPQLPDEARNVVSRTLRLNQVSAVDAANFLTAQGAETQIARERIEIQTIGEGAAARTVEIRTPEILALRAEDGVGPLLLRGLSVTTNDRLNSITLVGTPRQLELASSFLTQLDLRRRQVAVNVRIIDVNLLNTQDFSTSFAFGIGDTFFSVDGGAGRVGYGDFRPPTDAEIGNSLTGRPTIPNPFTEGEPLLGEGFFNPPPGGRPSADPPSTGSPLQPGITDFTPGTPATTSFEIVPTAVDPVTGEPTGFRIVPTVTPGTPDEYEFGLPTFFQYPRDFLASLRAQIISGNAKILTDPTLIVQEGQTASVNLTQEVVTNITVNRDVTAGGISESTEFELAEAGLVLELVVDRIDDNGFITLAVNPSVSAPSTTFNTGEGEITLLARRELQSGQVRLRDGQTLILSGIIQETDRTTVSKVPILGDIPILGALFRSTNRENTRQEVIVLVTPQILDDSDRATFGYGYTPGRQVQEVLQRQQR